MTRTLGPRRSQPYGCSGSTLGSSARHCLLCGSDKSAMAARQRFLAFGAGPCSGQPRRTFWLDSSEYRPILGIV
eukprot:2962908-Prymnesium_polylepis.1